MNKVKDYYLTIDSKHVFIDIGRRPDFLYKEPEKYAGVIPVIRWYDLNKEGLIGHYFLKDSELKKISEEEAIMYILLEEEKIIK